MSATGSSTTSNIPRGLILLAVSLCTMLYAITLTIVNVVLPQMQGALSATPDQISWVVTLNVIATAVATPMTGWMVARWGYRNVLLWSIIGFDCVGSMRLSRYARAAIDLSRRTRRVWRPAGTAGASDHRRRVSARTARIRTGHIWYRCCNRTGDRPGDSVVIYPRLTIGGWCFCLFSRSVPRHLSLYGCGCTTRTNVIQQA